MGDVIDPADQIRKGRVVFADDRRRFAAAVVDQQNAGDPAYTNMSGRLKESAAFQAASDLVFKGLSQPSGYTEPLLHAWRLKVKAAA